MVRIEDPGLIRKNFNVVLERTVRELNGESCISLEEAPPPKQQIVCSRSFGERVTTYEAMRQAVCQHAERAAEKLRGERQFCRHIAVFVKTSPFAVTEPYYGNLASEKLLNPHAGYTGHHCRCRQSSGQDLGGWSPLRKGRLYAERFHTNRGIAAEFV